MTRYPFPYVKCGNHPGPQLALIVCVHVFDGQASPTHVIEPTRQETGEALCEKCHHATPQSPDGFKVVCRSCFYTYIQPDPRKITN